MFRRLFLVVLSASALWAADASLGTWKLNVAKSTFKPGPPPAAETRVYQAQPKGVKVTVTTVWADRLSTTVEYPANYDGKDYPVTGSRDVDAVALSRMDDFDSAAILKHAGKEIGTARRVVSPDRKTMTISYKGINTRGDQVDNIAVYDRQ
ncbi:MAG: hypothetical protein JWO19_5161 [Bryobacterales bacterium]|nr:hypothetical protein [Bryobacterales bacterium]